MPTRNVVITQHQAEMVDQLVRDGRFQNASEVLREGLRLVDERETVHAAKLEAIRAAVEVGWMEADLNRVETFDDVDALKARIAEIGARARNRAR